MGVYSNVNMSINFYIFTSERKGHSENFGNTFKVITDV